MGRLVLTQNDLFKLQLPVLAAIYGYDGLLHHQDCNLPHPGALINASWRGFANSVNSFFVSYEAYNSAVRTYTGPKTFYTPPDQNNPSLDDIVMRYRQIIYQFAELTENLTKNLKKCFLPEKHYSQWQPNILKRWVGEHPWIACQQLKHDHNQLVSVEIEHPITPVRGYAVCHHQNEGLRPNMRIHQKQQAFAFGNDLRKIFSNLYLAANAVGEQISAISQANFIQTDLQAPHASHLQLLTKVSSFMPFGFRDQKPTNTAVFTFDGQSLLIADSQGSAMTPSGGRIKTTYSGDGHTKKFHYFYP